MLEVLRAHAAALTVVQVVTFLLAFAANASKILNASRPFWERFPGWFQRVAPPLLLVLGSLPQVLSGVQSWSDFAVAVLVAIGLGLPSKNINPPPPPTGGDGSEDVSFHDRKTPPDPIMSKLHISTLAVTLCLLAGCAQVKGVVYPIAVDCGGGIADEALQTTLGVLLRGDNYKAALDELAKVLGGETGKAAVVCGVNELLDRWKTKEVTARSLVAPEKPVAVVNAEAFLAMVKTGE